MAVIGRHLAAAFHGFHLRAVLFLVGRIVFAHALRGIGIASQHDVLHERVGINLQVVVDLLGVKGVGLPVGGAVGVQPVGRFPGIGNAVAVGVIASRPTARAEIGLGISVHVAHSVDASLLLAHRTRVGGRAVAGLLEVTGVHIVLSQRGAGMGQHLVEGLGCRVGGHFARRSARTVELNAHAVLAGRVLLVGHGVAVEMLGVDAPVAAVDGKGAAVIADSRPPVEVGLLVHLVAVDEVAAGHAHQVARGGVARCAHRHLRHATGAGGGARLVVVVHNVDVATTRTAIAAVAAVVDDAVAEVHVLGLHVVGPFILSIELVRQIAVPLVAGSVEARRAVVHVADEVVVERGQLAAPDAAIAVGTLAVAGVVQAFADGTPLHGEIIVVVERGHLVDRPREGAVVEHDAGVASRPGGIGAVVDVALLATAAADEANHDVIAAIEQRVVAQGDARCGRRLSQNSGVGPNGDVAAEGDDAAHVEHHHLLVRPLHRLAERASAAVVERRHVNHLAAPATGHIAAMTLGTRESRRLCPCGHDAQAGYQPCKNLKKSLHS